MSAGAQGPYSVDLPHHPPLETMPRNIVLALALCCAALAACTSATFPAPDGVPAAIRAPGDDRPLFAVHAEGTQSYECSAANPQPQWVFKGPHAVLTGEHGEKFGTHYPGPTWEAADGSKLVGEVVASAPAADGQSIAQLLLKAKTRPEGVFANVRTIQRLETRGGQAPQAACPVSELGRRVDVPYTATYVFLGERRPLAAR